MAHKSPMLHSIYDLTTFCRATTGDVPPKLIGASTTVVGSKMFLFGGRLVTERRIVSDLYVFDMDSFVWEHIPNLREDGIPPPRYFHSADAWNNHLIVFGGMSSQADSVNPEELCVLNDIHFFNLTTRQWLPAPPLPELDPSIPRGRYAHLSSVSGDRLFIIGGQDFHNTWLDDVCMFDFVTQKWTQQHYPRHCGTYRSVAVSSPTVIRMPEEEISTRHPPSGPGQTNAQSVSARPTTRPSETTSSENLIHLPYLSAPSMDYPSDIYLYSNYNFTDVKRELEIFKPLPDGDFSMQDRSLAMTGSTFPPGLRFPTGAVLGTYLIIAGTYLAHSYQSFSIWVLDLTSMIWSRIDPGKAIESGSWFRGCLHAEASRFLIFGNRYGNLVEDYNRRLLSWDHVSIVDLEAFGIYQPPPLKLDIRMQELGLAAFEERILTDLEIICEDGQRIPCSRRLLEERWEWFKISRLTFLQKANHTMQELPNSPMHMSLPELPGLGLPGEPRGDPRLTPRAFYLSEPYPVVLAFLQYLYSLALITPLQHTPGVLGQLLIMATTYQIPHLESLVKHAMHRSLTNANSVGVYEVTTLCSCRSLQIRALKTVMAYTQKRPSRRDAGSGNSRSSDNAGGGGFGGDATWRHIAENSDVSSAGYNFQSNEYLSTTTSKIQSTSISMNGSLSDSSSSSVMNGPVVGSDGELSNKKFSPSMPTQIPSAYVSRNDQLPKSDNPDKLTISASALKTVTTLSASISPRKTAQAASGPPSSKAPGAGTMSRQNSSLTPIINSAHPKNPASTGEQTHSLSPTASPVILPPPMLSRLPQRPNAGEGQFSPTQTPLSQSTISLGDIRGRFRARNNSDAANSNPSLKGSSGHTKQSLYSKSATFYPRDLRSDAKQDRTALANPNSSSTALTPLSYTLSRSPLSEQRSGFISPIITTIPSSFSPISESKFGTVKKLTEFSGDSIEQKPVHWPKQAPNVHWITPELTSSP